MYLNFKWRASLVPAAAVIPAPLAYTIIVAVKRLVVGLNNLYTHTINNIYYSTNIHTHTFNNRYVKKKNNYVFKSAYIIYLSHHHIFNTVNKSECIKHVFFECALNVLSWDVALSYTHTIKKCIDCLLSSCTL